MKKWMDAWGYYVLAALCAGIILFSAVWTRSARPLALPDAQALSDASQRLSDVTPAPTETAFHRPAAGDAVRPFSPEPVFFPDTGLWQIHPGTDFSAAPGDPVRAVLSGKAEIDGGILRIAHGQGLTSEYRGLAEITVKDGQSVKAGEIVGKAGSSVPFEGGGIVCIRLYRDGKPVPWNPDDF